MPDPCFLEIVGLSTPFGHTIDNSNTDAAAPLRVLPIRVLFLVAYF